MCCIKSFYPVLVFWETEKIIFFFEFIWLFEMIRTDKYRKISFSWGIRYEVIIFFKCFTSNTVFPFIDSLIYISFIKTVLEHITDNTMMSLLSRTNKVCISKIKIIPHFLVFCCHHIEILHDRDTCFFSFYDGLLTIFIYPCRETSISSMDLVVEIENICNSRGIKMSHMRDTISIINRGRNIELFCIWHRTKPR